jgi:hypothetical protein
MPEVKCPNCLQDVKFADEVIGKRIRCFSCGHQFMVDETGPGELRTRDAPPSNPAAGRPPFASAPVVARNGNQESEGFHPFDALHPWAEILLVVWKCLAVLTAFGLVLAGIAFFLNAMGYQSQPSTSAYGRSLAWNGFICFLAAPIEFVVSFGLIDFARSALNIESILLDIRDKSV